MVHAIKIVVLEIRLSWVTQTTEVTETLPSRELSLAGARDVVEGKVTNDSQLLGCLCTAADSELVCIPICLISIYRKTWLQVQGLTLHFSSQVVNFFFCETPFQSPFSFLLLGRCLHGFSSCSVFCLDSCSVPLHLS